MTTNKTGGFAPLKNTHSRSTRIEETIRTFLVRNGALDVNFRNDPSKPLGSKPVSVTFSMLVDGPSGKQELHFRMIARYDQVRAALRADAKTHAQVQRITQSYVEQVTWANIRDWLAAQVTMIRIGQFKLHEVFLSQLLEYNGPDARTMFQVIEENNYRLLEQNSLPAPGEEGERA